MTFAASGVKVSDLLNGVGELMMERDVCAGVGVREMKGS